MILLQDNIGIVHHLPLDILNTPKSMTKDSSLEVYNFLKSMHSSLHKIGKGLDGIYSIIINILKFLYLEHQYMMANNGFLHIIISLIRLATISITSKMIYDQYTNPCILTDTK
jgi:hypothetical protein